MRDSQSKMQLYTLILLQGGATINQMHKIVQAHNSKMRLLISSIREPSDIADMAAQVIINDGTLGETSLLQCV